MSSYCISEKDIESNDYPFLGGKALAFAKIREYCLPVPEWFVVKNQAFYDSLTQTQKVIMKKGDSKEIREALEEFTFTKKFIMELSGQLGKLYGEYFAVRSSALSEDSGQNSFAGQFETYLWLTRGQVLEYIRECFLSAFSERVVAYRKNNHIEGMLEVPSVIVQRMINADCAGVCFAVNPQDADVETSVVSAVYGLGSALVDGVANSDVYYVKKGVHLHRQVIAKKNLMHVIVNNKVTEQEVPDAKKNMEVLTRQQVMEVTRLARKTSQIFGKYQDIEWAYEDGNLYLLQSRPITSLGQVMPRKEKAFLYDNSNIAESYNGVTLPMTFSFIRIAYDGVYRQMCKMFGVSKKQIVRHDRMFRNMLGMTDGRVYYNMRSWYQMMSILPGYKFNKEFMEQMMGVKEKLPEGFVIEDNQNIGILEKIVDGLHLGWSMVMFVVQYIGIEKNIEQFYKRIEKTLGAANPKELPYMAVDELYEYFKHIEKHAIAAWDAPLINDIFTMIFHGILRKLCDKWIGIDGICNGLLCGQGGIISAKPARMIWDMSRLAMQDERLVKCLQRGSIGKIEEHIRMYAKLKNLVDEYLEEFGDRCLDELKLESESVSANPLLFYRTIGETAKHTASASGNASADIAKESYEKAMEQLKWHPVRRWIFKKVLKNAGRFVKNRENLRFERTKVFGRARTIFNEMGMRFASTHVLEEREDIFYLNLEEVLSFIDGTSTSYHLKEVVRIRKAEYEAYQKMPEVPRFMVYGQVGMAVKETSFNKQKDTGKKKLVGIPCSPGVVEGKARVILDCRKAVMKEGEILIANHTDPGWIMLFNQASAVVVECGSLLSHAAIVSREMGIPSVVAVDDVSKLIHTGDRIRVDGSTGIITILEKV